MTDVYLIFLRDWGHDPQAIPEIKRPQGIATKGPSSKQVDMSLLYGLSVLTVPNNLFESYCMIREFHVNAIIFPFMPGCQVFF
jgi:hypothetical protein